MEGGCAAWCSVVLLWEKLCFRDTDAFRMKFMDAFLKKATNIGVVGWTKFKDSESVTSNLQAQHNKNYRLFVMLWCLSVVMLKEWDKWHHVLPPWVLMYHAYVLFEPTQLSRLCNSRPNLTQSCPLLDTDRITTALDTTATFNLSHRRHGEIPLAESPVVNNVSQFHGSYWFDFTVWESNICYEKGLYLQNASLQVFILPK